MAQVEQLDANLEQTIEACNYANIQLDKIDADLASNAKHLVAAKKSLVVAQARIAERLRDLYVNGQGDSTLEVLLGLEQPRRHHRAARRDRARLEPGRADPRGRSSSTARRSRRGARTSSRRAPTRREIVAERAAQKQLDRVAARRAEPAARVRQGRDRADPGRGAAPAGCARRAGASAGSGAAARRCRPAGRTADVRPAVVDAEHVRRRHSRGALRPGRRHRAPVPRHPVRLGRLEPVDRLRLLRASRATSSRRSASTCRTTRRRSSATARRCPYDQLAPGDLVFFSGLGHVGIYIGGGQFVHAPHTGDVVKISSLAEHWYSLRRRPPALARRDPRSLASSVACVAARA